MRAINIIIWFSTIGQLFSSSLLAQSDNGCILRRDQDSVRVFTCHSENSKFKSIQASFQVNTSFSKLASMVMDIPDYENWQYNTINPKILKRISNSEIIYYVEVKAPWPISNRDMIIRLTLVQDSISKTMTITANGEPDYLPVNEGVVRVPMSQSKWIVKSIGKNKLVVNYSIQIDPGGSVPAWMVNMVSADAPYISFNNFRNQIHKHRLDSSITIKD